MRSALAIGVDHEDVRDPAQFHHLNRIPSLGTSTTMTVCYP